MKRQALLVALVAFVGFVSGGWLLQRGSQSRGNVYQVARLFDDILAHIADYYVDSLDEGQLYNMAIDGMLAQLNDPYTSFLREEELRNLTLSTTGNYAGLGIRIEVRDGWITIITPLADTPAERVGLRAGDRIVEVAGSSTRGWSSDRAVAELRGDAGTQVEITVVRAGVPDRLRFTITRGRIHVNSVDVATLLRPDIGYVLLTTVSQSSVREVSKAVGRLRDEGARGIILDLRNNPGGVLEQGVGVADLFLESGRVVVETKGRAPGVAHTYRSRDRESWPGMPVIVLVSYLSASAAEIIAGALQDHDRALILGAPTFGKGVAQHVFRFNAKEALRVTTSRWYTPSGRSIQRHWRGAVVGDSAGSDSTRVYRSAAGRAILGGGGIRPDLEIQPDTLTTEEQNLTRALGSNLPVFQDVLTTYVLELKGANTIRDIDFRVLPAMLNELLRRLRERGVDITRPDWDRGRSLVRRQLSYEIARYVFGRDAEIKRRAASDSQVQKALELLGEASTPEALFSLAGSTY